MKKWIIAICVVISGLLLFAIAAKLCGDLDVYHLSQPVPHGQFEGSDQEMLYGIFFILLAGVSLLVTFVSTVATGLKWNRMLFRNVTYLNLLYWTLCIPIVIYIICYSSWALWHTIHNCMRYLW